MGGLESTDVERPKTATRYQSSQRTMIGSQTRGGGKAAACYRIATSPQPGDTDSVYNGKASVYNRAHGDTREKEHHPAPLSR
jgi:hypothetical protein